MISVIIPTLNEALRLPALLERIASEPISAEVIVVDGGSTDGTPEIARQWTKHVFHSPPGRGQQLRLGADVSHGDILLFLHADSALANGCLVRLRETLDREPSIVGGNFRLVFDGADGFSRWLTHFYAWLRRHSIYYGDSGVFIRRSAYDAIGGIRPVSLMEDYDLVRRLEAFGRTSCIEEPPLGTSSRRFIGRHPVLIVLGWLWIHALFHLRVPPQYLALLYDSMRRRGSNQGEAQE
jgi:rSAM/selenodomain-associated transferase 2